MYQAEERKAALRKIPEQVILSEVRRMVEEMQSLNKKLEETVSSRFFYCMCLSIIISRPCIELLSLTLMLCLVVDHEIDNCKQTQRRKIVG